MTYLEKFYDSKDNFEKGSDDGEDIFEEAFVNGENGIDIDVDDCETSLKFLMIMATSSNFFSLDAIEVMFVSQSQTICTDFDDVTLMSEDTHGNEDEEMNSFRHEDMEIGM